jgi:uncharacterized protein
MPRILISGASGLIGSALAPSLESQGYEVIRMVRRESKSNELRWAPLHPIPTELVSDFDAVIHLSGESITGRWTAAKKTRIRESRVVSTRNLSEALARTDRPPKTFLCASATGYYDSRGDEVLTEESPIGTGFLPEVCKEWESATAPAADAGIRAVNLRTGLVLSKNGGSLKAMLLPFRLGLGGKIGSGRQWWSWIHIEDWVAAVHHILRTDSASGPVNMVSPDPVTNAEFTKTLAKALKRPAIFPIPGFAARLALGELADEALLASARVEPRKLVEGGFQFKFPDLRSALENLLKG